MKRLLLALLALMLSACTSAVGGKPTASSTTPPSPLPDDLLVFRVSTGPGYSPQLAYLTAGPSVSIYGDGRVMVTEAESLGVRVLEVGEVSPQEIAQFVADAVDSGLFQSSEAYGEVQVTDQGSTTVTLSDGEEDLEVAVYALEHASGLPKSQAKKRAALLQLIDDASQLGDPGPATPDRIQVASAKTTSTDSGLPAWPGPDPATFMADASGSQMERCGVLSGADAGTVYDAALENSEQIWIVNGQPALLAVRPLLPDEPGCS